jgi:hypothetical protein
VLDVVARFMAKHPREVVILFVEPYLPVQEIQASMERSGLLGQAARLHRDEPLPTLGELIDADTRLVVFAEEDGGSRDWYLPGFSFVQDTPLTAHGADESSCEFARGTPDSPMLLINHWSSSYPPTPSRNERIGGPVLKKRLERCERRRDQLPNLVAVDFYERTDVVRIAREMNAR